MAGRRAEIHRENSSARLGLRIVDRGVQAGMACRVLHLVESPPLFIESELDLCRLLQLPRLIPVERPFGWGAPRLRLNRGVELVEARLQIGHLKILRQDLPFPLVRRS